MMAALLFFTIVIYFFSEQTNEAGGLEEKKDDQKKQTGDENGEGSVEGRADGEVQSNSAEDRVSEEGESKYS